MSTQAHEPAGQPTGGQFAVGAKRETGTRLAASSDTKPAGIDLTGTAAEVRTQAIEAYKLAETILALAAAKDVAQEILGEYPAAAYLVLDESDQGSGGYGGLSIVDASGGELASFEEEFSDEFDVNLFDLPTEEPYVEAPPGSRTGLVPDPRFAFLDYGRRAGHDGDARLDLVAAAAIDLQSI